MRDQKPVIYILSDQKLRGEIIRKLLKHAFSESYNIFLLESDSYNKISPTDYKSVIIIDFIALNKTPKAIIEMLAKCNHSAKLIAMHLYRSTTLIKPLFDMGINGYVYSEPSREELTAAVHSVLSEKDYIPSFLIDR